MTDSVESVIAKSHLFDFDISAMYAYSIQPYSSHTPMSIKITYGKGRKGKPHWRHFRALRCDLIWKTHWDNLWNAYQQYKFDNNIMLFWDSNAFKEWITPQLTNARVVFDSQYSGCMAIDFEDEEARILFYLRWS